MSGHCEFVSAVMHNDPQYLQQILTEYPDIDVNAPIVGQSTALHIAAEEGYHSLVKALIARGGDVTALDEKGSTPLLIALLYSPLVSYYLLKGNADVIKVYSNNRTVLHSVIRMNCVGLAQMILARGGDPTLYDNNGDTPLSLAIRGYPDMAEELLFGSTYVDPNISGDSVRCSTPLLFCLKSNMFSLARALVLAGYRAPLELEQYHLDPRPDPQNRRRLTNASKAAKTYFKKDSGIMPLSLQGQARLVVRRQLKTDIRTKIDKFPYPQLIKDYLLFKDVYNPLDLDTEEKAVAYMLEHRKIINHYGDIIYGYGD